MNRNHFTPSPSDFDQRRWWLAPLSVVVAVFASLALVGVEFKTTAGAPQSTAAPNAMSGPTAEYPIGDDLVVAPNLAQAGSAPVAPAERDVLLSSTFAPDNHPATF
jgi:hypothetical protein